jgi:clan AA aspartic protease (TIGR02281 family)
MRKSRTSRLGLGLLLVLLVQPAIAEVIQMRPHAGGYLISGRVNGALSVDFLLDTGATDVSIPDEVAQALARAGTLTAGDFIGTRTYLLADGSRVLGKQIILRELIVGNQRVVNVTASIGPARSQPLLGQSFLSRFPSWMLDNQRQVLVLSTGGETVGPTAAVNSPPRAIGAPAYGAYGAVAFDLITAKYGFAWNQDTQTHANEAALQACNSDACKVVIPVAPHRCAAFATAEKGSAWGGNVNTARDQAKLRALENCQKNTSGKCVLRGSLCN